VLTDVNDAPPVPLDAQHAGLLQQLQSQSGKIFDAAYIQGQIVGHLQLLNIQQAFLNSTLTGNNDEHIAVLARVVIQMHLTMLQEVAQYLAVARPISATLVALPGRTARSLRSSRPKLSLPTQRQRLLPEHIAQDHVPCFIQIQSICFDQR
jgi:hypothetical protein